MNYKNYRGKVKQVIIMITSFLIMGCCISGCKGGSSEYETTNKQEKEAKKVADAFVKKITSEDYENIKNYTYLPDGAFITDKDISWYVPRSDLSDLVGAKDKKTALYKMDPQISSINDDNNQNTSSKKLTYVTEDEKEYKIIVLQDKENHWKVYFSQLYHQGFTLTVKKNETIYINDMEVPEDYIVDNAYNTSKDSVVYSIPYVPNREFKITSSSGAEVIATPSESNMEIK